MKMFLILIAMFIFSSCSTYTWVDMDDCKEKVLNVGKCREVK